MTEVHRSKHAPRWLRPVLRRSRVGEMLRISVFLVVLATVPIVLPPYELVVVIEILTIAALGVAWNMVGGLVGYVSLANHAFYGLGGYALAACLTTQSVPVTVALVAATAAGALAAALIGMPVLRLRGHYFIVGSFAAGTATGAVFYVVGILGATPGGPVNLPFDGMTADEANRTVFVMTLIALALAMSAFVLLKTSRWGLGLQAVRSNEDAAQGLGVKPFPLKMLAFTISGALTGLVGGIGAYRTTYVDPQQFFDLGLLILIIVTVVLGGLGSTWGPVLGAIFVVTLTQALGELRDYETLVYAVLVIGIVLVEPEGLVKLPARVLDLARRKLAPILPMRWTNQRSTKETSS